MRHPRLVVTGLLVVGLSWLVFLPASGHARPPERLTHFLTDALQGLQDVLDDFHQEINPNAMAHVLVAPTKQPPGDLDGFPAEGRLIGVISTSHPLARFGLRRPGVYAIRLRQTADGTWQVAFLNDVGLASSVFAVEVKSASETYPQPQAFFTFYTRGIVICWQRTCVEI
jgi:hypothetical protein